MSKDLGTYFVKVIFNNGDGFIEPWYTGYRFTKGSKGFHPIDAELISPIYKDESELLSSIEWMYTEGNFGCDCNLERFLDRAYNREKDPIEYKCGDSLVIDKLVVIAPDLREIELI